MNIDCWNVADISDYDEIRSLIISCDYYRGFTLNRNWNRLISDINKSNVYIHTHNDVIVSTFSITNLEINSQFSLEDSYIVNSKSCFMSRNAVHPHYLESGSVIGGLAFLNAIGIAKKRHFRYIVCEINKSIRDVYIFLSSIGFLEAKTKVNKSSDDYKILYRDLYEYK